MTRACHHSFKFPQEIEERDEEVVLSISLFLSLSLSLLFYFPFLLKLSTSFSYRSLGELLTLCLLLSSNRSLDSLLIKRERWRWRKSSIFYQDLTSLTPNRPGGSKAASAEEEGQSIGNPRGVTMKEGKRGATRFQIVLCSNHPYSS